MRILQVLLDNRIGGAESLARNLESEWGNHEIISETHFLDERGSAAVRRVNSLHQRISHFKPDVLVAHSAIPSVYSRIVGGPPVVSVLHSAKDDFLDTRLRVAEHALRLRTKAVVAVSESQAQIYLKHFPARVEKVHVIPNGVRPFQVDESKVRSPQRVMTVARFAEQKNPSLWAASARLCGEFAFEWWGPIDPDLASLARTISDLPNAALKGPTDAVGRVLSGGGIFLLTSREEAHSISLLEAAYAGLPIVCSSRIAQTTLPGLPFRTFATDTPEDVADALRDTRDSWSDALAHARRYRRIVTDRHSIRATAQDYMALFRRLIRA